MRYLVISDIHANLTAFLAVLREAGKPGVEYDLIWCLGDVVGYGPDPNECVELLNALPHFSLAGNHDWVVIGKADGKAFHAAARHSAKWTHQVLNKKWRAYLASLPVTQIQGDFTLAHASPRDPVWEYILSPAIASQNFGVFQTPYCLVGHTHVPIHYRQTKNSASSQAVQPVYGVPLSLAGGRQILNPGSVGQPRDKDTRAAYAILDDERQTWEFRRVPYDIESVQRRMRNAGLPEILIIRLEQGW